MPIPNEHPRLSIFIYALQTMKFFFRKAKKTTTLLHIFSDTDYPLSSDQMPLHQKKKQQKQLLSSETVVFISTKKLVKL